jgi:hypothetical protein
LAFYHSPILNHDQRKPGVSRAPAKGLYPWSKKEHHHSSDLWCIHVAVVFRFSAIFIKISRLNGEVLQWEVLLYLHTVCHSDEIGLLKNMRGFQPFLFGLNAVYYLRKV